MPKRSPATLCLAFALASLAALGTGLAVDREEPNAAVDLTSVRAKIKAKDWLAAIAELKPIVARIDDPDAYNLYAFSLRNAVAGRQARGTRRPRHSPAMGCWARAASSGVLEPYPEPARP